MYNGFSEESLKRIAQQKVNFRLSVKIHVGVYIIVSLLLLGINILFTPSILWIIFPFFGWLIGVMMHTVAYLVYAKGVYPMAKRGVIFHFTAYIFVNLLLFVINYFTYPIFYWVSFPAMFWAVALILHLIAYFTYYRGRISEQGSGISRRERAIEKELEKMKKRMKQKSQKGSL
ncbi:MAG: 2TM domain-containing protein [Candidatus Thorarchaeota archaeon]